MISDSIYGFAPLWHHYYLIILFTFDNFISSLYSIFYDFSLQGLNYDNAVVVKRDSRPIKRKREDSEGRVRSSSKMPRDQSGVRDVKVCFLFTIDLLHFNCNSILMITIFLT